jgi:hypothetical protein
MAEQRGSFEKLVDSPLQNSGQLPPVHELFKRPSYYWGFIFYPHFAGLSLPTSTLSPIVLVVNLESNIKEMVMVAGKGKKKWKRMKVMTKNT